MSVDGGTPLTHVNPAPGSPSVHGVGDRRGHAAYDGKRGAKKDQVEGDEELEEVTETEEPPSEEAEHIDITV